MFLIFIILTTILTQILASMEYHSARNVIHNNHFGGDTEWCSDIFDKWKTINRYLTDFVTYCVIEPFLWYRVIWHIRDVSK